MELESSRFVEELDRFSMGLLTGDENAGCVVSVVDAGAAFKGPFIDQVSQLWWELQESRPSLVWHISD